MGLTEKITPEDWAIAKKFEKNIYLCVPTTMRAVYKGKKLLVGIVPGRGTNQAAVRARFYIPNDASKNPFDPEGDCTDMYLNPYRLEMRPIKHSQLAFPEWNAAQATALYIDVSPVWFRDYMLEHYTPDCLPELSTVHQGV